MACGKELVCGKQTIRFAFTSWFIYNKTCRYWYLWMRLNWLQCCSLRSRASLSFYAFYFMLWCSRSCQSWNSTVQKLPLRGLRQSPLTLLLEASKACRIHWYPHDWQKKSCFSWKMQPHDGEFSSIWSGWGRWCGWTVEQQAVAASEHGLRSGHVPGLCADTVDFPRVFGGRHWIAQLGFLVAILLRLYLFIYLSSWLL